MTLTSLQALTWSTIAGAVVGALWLASAEADLKDHAQVRRSVEFTRISLPITTTQKVDATGIMPVAEQTRTLGSR